MSGEAVVRKSEFAAMRNVSAGRVTQWITSGRIGSDALVGKGPTARIRVDLATAHLRERLDPSQRFGMNGIATRLDSPPPHAAEKGQQSTPSAPSIDTVEARIKAEKLRQAELTTRRAEEQDRLVRGVYILASEARCENTRLASKLFEAFEGALIEFASALAAQYKIPARDSLHLLRKEMRRVRERVAADYEMLAGQEVATVEDNEVHDCAPQQ